MIPALANHLWQSTLVVLFAGLLTLMVRRNGAAVRYGLWLAASVKFLVPFALLAAAGGLAVDRLHLSLPAPQGLRAIAPVVQPLAEAPAPVAALAAPTPDPVQPKPAPRPAVAESGGPAAIPIDPAPVLLAVWALGLAAVLIIWARRWSRISAALRAARPARLPAPVPVLSTPFPMEPGVIGVRRPVILVPQGIAEHLSPAEWQAVLAHELSHIRRRDNFTALVHMLVQALFWFHPVVWWLGARLVAEREQACDEAVVRSGADARTYAEGILKVCRLYVQQPLACAAGVSGADLKARVKRILTAPSVLALSRPKKALLLAAGAAALATPVMAGLLSTPQGQQIVTRTATLASVLSPDIARLAPPAPLSDDQPAQRTTLPRQALALAAPVALASLDKNPVSLTHDLTAPRIDASPSAQPSAETAAEPSAAPALNASDARQDATAFVRSFSNALWNSGPICIRIQGAPADKNAAMLARVEADARSAGVDLRRSGCEDLAYNVEIRFAADGDRAVRDVLAEPRQNRVWPDPMQRPQGANRPIRAWYEVADDLAGGGNYTPWVPGVLSGAEPQIRDSSPGLRKRLGLAIVVVDPERTAGMSLDALSDYVAMLALTQPRALDRCNVLPSVTDLYAGACPGRAAPTGLTSADAAYLKALYAGNPGLRATRFTSDLAEGMAKRLVGSGLAAASFAPPKEDQMPKLVPAVLTAAALASTAAAQTTYIPPGAPEPRFGGEFSLSEHGAAVGYWRAACYHWHVRSEARRTGPIASPAMDAAFKRFVSGLIDRKPAYTDMSRPMAEAVRKNLTTYWPSFNRMGHATVARHFDTTVLGEQLYVLNQAGGITHWNLVVDPEGKITAAFYCAGTGL